MEVRLKHAARRLVLRVGRALDTPQLLVLRGALHLQVFGAEVDARRSFAATVAFVVALAGEHQARTRRQVDDVHVVCPAPFGEAMRAVEITVVVAEGGHGGRGTDELSHGVQAGADFQEREREVRASGERSVATDRPGDVRNDVRITISGKTVSR